MPTQRGLKEEGKESTGSRQLAFIFISIQIHTHTHTHKYYTQKDSQIIPSIQCNASCVMHPPHCTSPKISDASTLLTRTASASSTSSAEQCKSCKLSCINRKVTFMLPVLISENSYCKFSVPPHADRFVYLCVRAIDSLYQVFSF